MLAGTSTQDGPTMHNSTSIQWPGTDFGETWASLCAYEFWARPIDHLLCDASPAAQLPRNHDGPAACRRPIHFFQRRHT